MDDFVSVSEAAEKLGIGVNSVRYYIKKYPGKIELAKRRDIGKKAHLILKYSDLIKIIGLAERG